VLARVTVVGRGRVGAAVAARLEERGIEVGEGGELRLLCVPDSAIAAVARSIEPGPWVAHVSGATPLEALAPHLRRFSVHPLQTFTLRRGAEQLDGAWAAVTAETEEALELATRLAELLGLRPFELRDEARPLYHAGAAIASNFLVTLYRAAAALFAEAGAPPEALVPLMRRTIENGFELTGPIARGDLETIERHLAAIRASSRSDLLKLYVPLAEATRRDAAAGDNAVVAEREIADIYVKLREQALDFGSSEIKAPPVVPGGRVLGVVMDLGYDTAVATVVGLSDGTTSMYVSNGGARIGIGEDAEAAGASRRWVEVAETAPGLTEAAGDALPDDGFVRFNVLTTCARLFAETREDDAASPEHPLFPLYAAGQDVISEIRRVDESRQEDV
jgi:predicted short-subunit dehydrogenase-like oxidoreductase (DUF2520 family)